MRKKVEEMNENKSKSGNVRRKPSFPYFKSILPVLCTPKVICHISAGGKIPGSFHSLMANETDSFGSLGFRAVVGCIGSNLQKTPVRYRINESGKVNIFN